jgi:chorismate mutase-like protein
MADLRARIDELDRALLEVLAERMAVCREVAELKAGSGATVIQPGRVREVLVSRREWAADLGVEPEFAEQLFRVVLAETHRIETASHAGGPRIDRDRPIPESALEVAACRIDHVAVAVPDVDAAASFFVETLGFRVAERRTDEGGLDSAVVEAGGVTIVLTGGHASDSRTARWLAEHGPGVQQLAVEVLNAGFVREALAASGARLLTDVTVGSNRLEQFFTLRDEASGLRLGFVSRTGDRAGFDGENIRALSEAMEAAEPD